MHEFIFTNVVLISSNFPRFSCLVGVACSKMNDMLPDFIAVLNSPEESTHLSWCGPIGLEGIVATLHLCRRGFWCFLFFDLDTVRDGQPRIQCLRAYDLSTMILPVCLRHVELNWFIVFDFGEEVDQ